MLTGATVESMILDRRRDDGEWVAEGVRFTHEGSSGYEVHVQPGGEVIVCAGSVQSPQLLELSGIGSAEVLEAAGVEVKIDNAAVGENLQEHMSMNLPYRVLFFSRVKLFPFIIFSDERGCTSDLYDLRNRPFDSDRRGASCGP